MNELTLIDYQGRKVINSRQVAEMVGKEHKNLLRDIKGYCDILTSSNLSAMEFFIEDTYVDTKGEHRPLYLITRKGCDMVANKMTGEKGVLFTAAYVTKFEEMEKQIVFAIPQTLSEALRLAADQAEVIEKQTKQIAESKPKVLFAESVQASHTAILIGELAKIIKQNGLDIGQNRLFEWLRKNGYLINRKGTDYNMPTQYAMDLGLFTIKETTVNHADGHISISKTPKVTGKGQIYFVNKFLSDVKGGKNDALPIST